MDMEGQFGGYCNVANMSWDGVWGHGFESFLGDKMDKYWGQVRYSLQCKKESRFLACTTVPFADVEVSTMGPVLGGEAKFSFEKLCLRYSRSSNVLFNIVLS